MKRRDNNRGFTLVELIIAVAILAIAISPLIANFIQSSKMNQRGRESLDGMNLAQDIMEGISGYTVDELESSMDEVVNDVSGTKTIVGKFLPDASEYSSITKDPVGTDGLLKYNITGIGGTGSRDQTIDMEIILDPTGSNQEAFNNQIMADISEINQYYDAVFTIPTDSDVTDAINTLSTISTSSLPKENYKGKLKRETEIKIVNTGTEAAPNYKVSVIRTYGAAQGENGVLGISYSDLHTISTDNICKMDSDKFPRNVYIYFTGIEGATRVAGGLERKESFTITNTTGKDITVYLIRTQKTTGVDAAPSQSEINYGDAFGAEVAIVSTDMSGTATENVYLVSNLRMDLNATSMRYNFRTKTEDGLDIYDAEGKPREDEDGNRLYPELPKTDNGTTITVGQSTYLADRAPIFYNSVKINEEKYLKYVSDGYARKDKNTLYKVTINLYDSVSGEKVATYDGGLSN